MTDAEDNGAAVITGLEAIRRQIARWVDYDVQQRAKEGLSSNDDTHLVSPPVWPSHGQLRRWAEVFLRAEQALAAAPPVVGWQDISSAPRNGTHFLAVDDCGDACRCAYHSEGYIMSFCGQPVVRPFEPIMWMAWPDVPPPSSVSPGGS